MNRNIKLGNKYVFTAPKDVKGQVELQTWMFSHGFTWNGGSTTVHEELDPECYIIDYIDKTLYVSSDVLSNTPVHYVRVTLREVMELPSKDYLRKQLNKFINELQRI